MELSRSSPQGGHSNGIRGIVKRGKCTPRGYSTTEKALQDISKRSEKTYIPEHGRYPTTSAKSRFQLGANAVTFFFKRGKHASLFLPRETFVKVITWYIKRSIPKQEVVKKSTKKCPPESDGHRKKFKYFIQNAALCVLNQAYRSTSPSFLVLLFRRNPIRPPGPRCSAGAYIS